MKEHPGWNELVEYAEGTHSTKRGATIAAHLQTCAKCTAHIAWLQTTMLALDEETFPAPPPEARAVVLDAFRYRPPQSRRKPRWANLSHRHWSIALVAAAALLILWIFPLRSPQLEAAIVEASGTVEITRQDSEPEPLSSQTELAAGDRIATADNGRMRLSFSEDAVAISLLPASELRIEGVQLRVAQPRQLVAHLEKGEIEASVQGSMGLALYTPAATIAVRDGAVKVRILENGRLTLEVRLGVVDIITQQGETRVHAGETMVLSSQEPPATATPIASGSPTTQRPATSATPSATTTPSVTPTITPTATMSSSSGSPPPEPSDGGDEEDEENESRRQESTPVRNATPTREGATIVEATNTTTPPTPTTMPQPRASATVEASATKEPSRTPRPSPTLASSATPTASSTPRPTVTVWPSATSSATATAEPSSTALPSATPSATAEGSSTPEVLPTEEPTSEPEPSPEPEPTTEPEPTETPWPTTTPSETETPLATSTPEGTATLPGEESTPTETPVGEETAMPSATAVLTETPEPIETPDVTATPDPEATPAPTVLPSPTESPQAGAPKDGQTVRVCAVARLKGWNVRMEMCVRY